MKGVYYALVLMVRNPRKISKQIKNQAAVDVPLVVLCTACTMPDSHWCIRMPMVTVGRVGFAEHIGVGLRRCSFRLARHIPRSLRT